MMEIRLLIVDEVHPSLMKGLAQSKIEFEYRPDWKREDVLLNALKFNGLVIRSKFRVDEELVTGWPTLQLIGRAGAGLDGIDFQATKRQNITVLHAAEGNADAVAEHTIALILMLLHKFPMADASVRGGAWDREAFRSTELKGKTVGLLGYGNMGTAVARRLQSFECEVIAYDKYLPQFPDQNARRVSLDELKAYADLLSLHVPLTEETLGMVDSEFLESFKKLRFLVNTSRGKIVSIGALVKALDRKFLLGAGLDVLPHEPPLKAEMDLSEKYQLFFQRPDVIFSPHVAGWSLESYERISEVLARKLIGFITQKEN